MSFFRWNYQPTEAQIIRNQIVVGWILFSVGVILLLCGFEKGPRYLVGLGLGLRSCRPKGQDDYSWRDRLMFALFFLWFMPPFMADGKGWPDSVSAAIMLTAILATALWRDTFWFKKQYV